MSLAAADVLFRPHGKSIVRCPAYLLGCPSNVQPGGKYPRHAATWFNKLSPIRISQPSGTSSTICGSIRLGARADEATLTKSIIGSIGTTGPGAKAIGGATGTE
jgi:hypothetical protein